MIVKSLVALIILFGASGDLALVLCLWLGVYIYVSYLLARRCRVYAQDFAAAHFQQWLMSFPSHQCNEIKILRGAIWEILIAKFCVPGAQGNDINHC